MAASDELRALITTTFGVGNPKIDADEMEAVLVKAADAIDEVEQNGGSSLVVPITRTADYTLALSDAGKAVRMNVASANTLTVPPNSSVAFAVGTMITVRGIGAGATTLTAGGGVTLNGSVTEVSQYGSVVLHKVATNEWDVYGGGSAGSSDPDPTETLLENEPMSSTPDGWTLYNNGGTSAIESGHLHVVGEGSASGLAFIQAAAFDNGPVDVGADTIRIEFEILSVTGSVSIAFGASSGAENAQGYGTTGVKSKTIDTSAGTTDDYLIIGCGGPFATGDATIANVKVYRIEP